MTLLSGYVLAQPAMQGGSRHRIARDELTKSVDSTNGSFTLRFDRVLNLGDYWEAFEFKSSVPLPNDGEDAGPVYTCQVIVCRSASRMLFLTERKKITDFVIDNFLSMSVYPNFRKVPIAIDKFVEACSRTDTPYAVTSLNGRYAGSERAIRTMILYGDEITDSSVFRENGHLFNFYNAGFRRRTVDRQSKGRAFDDLEVARIGNDGQLQTSLRDAERASEVLGVVKYIFDNGWAWVESWSVGEDV